MHSRRSSTSPVGRLRHPRLLLFIELVWRLGTKANLLNPRRQIEIIATPKRSSPPTIDLHPLHIEANRNVCASTFTCTAAIRRGLETKSNICVDLLRLLWLRRQSLIEVSRKLCKVDGFGSWHFLLHQQPENDPFPIRWMRIPSTRFFELNCARPLRRPEIL